MIKISGIIITYNVDFKIIEVVNSIINQVDNIIIVDNGSKEETINILQQLNQNNNVKIIYNSENVGIAKALNIGIRNAINDGAEWILTLDHDSVAKEDMVKNMLDFYNSMDEEFKKNIGILAPEITDISINKKLCEVIGSDNYMEMKHVIQSGSIIKSQIFDEIGYFEEKLFIYFVDIDFCYKIRGIGKKVVIVKDAILLHEEGSKERRKFLGLSFTYDNYSIYAIYYISRNAVYMFERYKKYEFIKRVVYDAIKILLSEPRKLKYLFSGLKDGILGRYGNKFS